ncbi:HPr family phosphocarrier protein [Kocuria palustris]|uniref:HPr family phosphocarrier protein n=1 Tax=Kocuria palustris TaxID=71999 RepID=UPI0011A76DCD|nr:HPr family phosphocarrier protein [Kocuria palustris]
MPSKKVIVGSAVGLHARPAAIISEAAGEYDEEILIGLVADPDEEPADASSSLLIMALGAEKGTEVEVSSDSAEAVEKIAGLIEQDLDAG